MITVNPDEIIEIISKLCLYFLNQQNPRLNK